MSADGSTAVPVLIRRGVAADARALEGLIRQLGYTEAAEDIAARLAALDPARQFVLVAERAGTVVGCLTTSIMHVLHRPRPVGRISMMVVEESLRGQHIGESLVRHAERELAQMGCGLVEVTSNEAREGAHRFYQRLGYQRTSLRFARDLSCDPA
jgi:predicted N-acetyltransferase YhbS